MNPEAVVNYLVEWLRNEVAEAGKSGVVLGVSGGVDSAVAALIAKRAFPDQMQALLLPCESDLTDLWHGQLLAEQNDIPYQIVDLDNPYLLLVQQFEAYLKADQTSGKLLKANIKPRLRMLALYYAAQARNYLVVGTSNKSELSVGYSTKYGDSAVDLQLLGDLLKREVFALAAYLKVPEVIINKPPSGGLWVGQTDEGEMGFTYEELDDYLSTGQGNAEVVARIEAMMKANQHKQRLPRVAVLPDYLRQGQ
ncbi:MAG: NAD(+) synthase [Syntrophomonadaceae bacterium]|jgi:NAD+ synthase|nr:NAD(+) synthase [Syntrophomonadaceae bacterium]